jgi:lipopolysaccharide transport system ATP-binding protein
MEPIIEIRDVSKEYWINTARGSTGPKRLTESMSNALIHPVNALRGIRGAKETFLALKDISFNVESGEMVGIIGRNGAGKSTLLKILSQITYPTRGEIVLRGRVGSLLEVGTGFHPDLTGRENIFLNGAILGMRKKEIEQKFDDIVKFAEVEKFLDTPIKRFSSGMYLRLAFSVAAHLDPDILIADEVLAVGDQQFQKKCLGKMREVSDNGRTVIFVSHDLHAIKSLCSTGILMRSGQIYKKGPVDEVMEEYALSLETQDGKFPVETADISIDGLEVKQNNRDVSLIDSTYPFSIVLRFRVPKEADQLRMGILVNNAMGDMLIRSYFSDWDSKFEHLDPGTYEAILEIPEKLLAAGNYSIILNAKKQGTIDMIPGHRVERSISLSAPSDLNTGGVIDPLKAQIILNRRWELMKRV